MQDDEDHWHVVQDKRRRQRWSNCASQCVWRCYHIGSQSCQWRKNREYSIATRSWWRIFTITLDFKIYHEKQSMSRMLIESCSASCRQNKSQEQFTQIILCSLQVLTTRRTHIDLRQMTSSLREFKEGTSVLIIQSGLENESCADLYNSVFICESLKLSWKSWYRFKRDDSEFRLMIKLFLSIIQSPWRTKWTLHQFSPWV